jgi:hypothetical protein
MKKQETGTVWRDMARHRPSTRVVCLLRITTSCSVRPVVSSESLTSCVIPTLQASVTLSQPHTSLAFPFNLIVFPHISDSSILYLLLRVTNSLMYNSWVPGRICNSSFLAKRVLLNNKVALENSDVFDKIF